MDQSRPRVVADIMTRRVVTLIETQGLQPIAPGMQRYRFRHLPVIDEEGKLVGLVTQRDILRASASDLEDDAAGRTQSLHERFTVADVMTRDVVTVGPDTPLAQAGRLLWERKLGCLPVTEDDGVLVGIVTEADFVMLAVRLLEA